jgi:hypothetical protein
MKLTNTNILLGKLFEKLKILMTKHSSTKEYNEVITLDSFYKNAIETIEELSDIKAYDETFIKRIISSITQVTATATATATGTAIQATNENKNIYINLYCSLLIIHYYPIVILDTIFLNAQTNISRLKTNIPKLKEDNYTQQINSITTEINQSEAAAAAAAATAAAAAAAAATAADDAAAATAAADAAAAAADAAAADAKNKTLAVDAADAAIAAANLAGEAASSAIIEAEQACNLITSAIERSEAVFGTTPKDLNIIRIKANALDKVSNARNKIAQLRAKSHAAIDAVDAITDAKDNNPLNLDRFTTNAQLPINEVNALVKTTREDANALRELLVAIEPSPNTIAARNRIFGFFGGSNTSYDTMVGGEDTDDIKNTLTIINDVLDETDKTGSLIKYSTEIFYKALTILSISIGLPIDLNSKNIIVNKIKNLVNDEVIQKFALSLSSPAAAAAPVAGVGPPPPPLPPPLPPPPLPPPPATPATPATTLTPAQEIETSINSIFDSSIDNYPYFGEIIDDIFNNFYNTDEKKLVDKLKRAQIEDTTKKNKLIEVQNNQNYAELAVNNAKKLAEKEHQIAKDAANSNLAIASNIKDSARSALGAFPSNIANDLEHAYTDLARANITKTKAAAAAAAAVPPVPQAITQAFDDANTAFDAATAAAALVDADAAAAVTTAAAAAAGTTFTSNDVTTFTNAITAFTNAKAKVEDADAATPATDATATNALSKAETATRTTREEAEKAAKGLESALAEVKAHANKKSKPITIKNMKSTIDAEILTHFKEIFKPQDSISKKVVKGGQKTQKNRYRGGIRKNINSIDSFDSIDSDL